MQGAVHSRLDAGGGDGIGVIEKEPYFRPVPLDHTPGEILGDNKGGLIVAFAHPGNGLFFIRQEKELKGARASLYRLQIFEQLTAGSPLLSLDDSQWQTGQFPLEGMAEDQQIEHRHEDTHSDNQGIAPELFQVPVDHRHHAHLSSHL